MTDDSTKNYKDGALYSSAGERVIFMLMPWWMLILSGEGGTHRRTFRRWDWGYLELIRWRPLMEGCSCWALPASGGSHQWWTMASHGRGSSHYRHWRKRNGFKYVVKFRGTGRWRLINGRTDRRLYSWDYSTGLVFYNWMRLQSGGGDEIQDLLKASRGLNLGLHFYPECCIWSHNANVIDAELASKCLVGCFTDEYWSHGS